MTTDVQNLDVRDKRYLRLAFALAEKAYSLATPNPKVGCVIADDQGIIGQGWHARCGQAHAEVVALENACRSVVGATAYVSLEPCHHHGKTPPCTQALIQHQIARVVYGVIDDNPLVGGRGSEALKQHGLVVDCAHWQEKHLLLNPGYVCAHAHRRPWLRLKLACSLDGSIGLENGQSQWISGSPARFDNQCWRARSDAVLSTWRTVAADQARLDVRQKNLSAYQPRRVILDRHLRLQTNEKIFTTDLNNILLVYQADLGEEQISLTRWQPMIDQGLTLEGLATTSKAAARDDFFDQVLGLLFEQNCREIQIEAGANLADFLLQTDRVDELLLYQSAVLLGREGVGFFSGAVADVNAAPRWQLSSSKKLGDDLRVQYLHPRWRLNHHDNV